MVSSTIKRIRKYHYSAIVPLILVVADLLIIVFLFDLMNHIWPVTESTGSLNFLNINVALSWILAGFITWSYKVEHIDKAKKIIFRTWLNFAVYLFLTFGLLYMIGGTSFEAAELLFISTIIFGTIISARVVMFHMYILLKHKFPSPKNIIIIGNNNRAKALSKHFLSTTSLPLKFFGIFDNNPPSEEDGKVKYLGKLEDVKKFCLENEVNEIYYTLDQDKDFFRELSMFADDNFIFLGVIPEIGSQDFNRPLDAILVNDSRIPVITSRKLPLQALINRQIKRLFDIIFSATVLLILSVTLFPIIAIAIRLDSPGPILFKQLRPGRNNKLFPCYKFRTMKVGSDDKKQATKNDSRITRVGAFLRKTSMDELPQFYNVLRGDMSVVGPRPNLVVHLEEYQKQIREYPQRHWILPGITGISQVNGLRGETKDPELMRKRVELDLFYLENWCLAMDIKIIIKTVTNMLKGEDAAY